MKITTFATPDFFRRIHTIMKTIPTSLVRSLTARRSKPTALRAVSFALIFGGLMVLGLSNRATGQGLVPERLSFQGYMEDGAGTPLGPTTPTNYPVVFRIFPTASAGTASWSERQTVTFDKGNYSVILGQGSPNGLEPHPILSTVVATAAGSLLYVETTVTVNGNDVKIQPRMQLLPTPYSFLATRSVTAATADTAVSVPGSAIQLGTITEDRLSDGVLSNIFLAPIADSRLSTNITQGPIDDSRLSTNITSGPIALSRLPAGFGQGSADTNNVARRDTTNTFTGTQTINGDLKVNGNVKLGATAQLSAIGAFTNLTILYGTLPSLDGNPDLGAIASGAGWTAARQQAPNDTRWWKVTFTAPFAAPPTVVTSYGKLSTVPIYGLHDAAFLPIHPSGTSFLLWGDTYSDAGPVDASFIAIGIR